MAEGLIAVIIKAFVILGYACFTAKIVLPEILFIVNQTNLKNKKQNKKTA